jgi:carbamate kinase
MTVRQAEQMMEAGAFDAGGMKPKVEAAAAFARECGGRAVIAHLGAGPAALRGQAGTTIVRDT